MVLGPLTAASYRAHRLTPSQIVALGHAADGLGDKAIARRMGIARGTAINHLRDARATLGVDDRTAAVVALHLAARRGDGGVFRDRTKEDDNG